MGAAVSRQVATSVNKTFTDITSNTSITSQSSCSAQAFSNQSVTIVSIKDSNIGSITLDAKSQISTTCLQSNENSADFSAKLTNDLTSAAQQVVKQNGLTLGANVSSSEITQINESVTKFAQNFNVSNLSTCIAQVVNNQDLNIGTVDGSTIGNITLAIDQSVVSKCIQENTAYATMESEVSNTLANKAQQTVSQGIDVGSIFILLAIVLLVVFMLFKGGIDVITKPQVIVPIILVVGVLIGIRFL